MREPRNWPIGASLALTLALNFLISEAAGAQDPPRADRVPPAIEGLRARDTDARRASAQRLRGLEKGVRLEALPVLIELLMKEKDGQVRLAVLDSVTSLGPEAEAAVPALLHTLRTNYGGQGQEESHQDYRSALALASIGKPAVEGLRGLLKEKKESVRAEVVMALGRIGPDAAGAVGDLIPLLGDASLRIRREASRSLGLIGPSAVDPLIASMTHPDAVIREAAAEALGFVPSPDDRVRRAAFDLSLDKAPEVRAAAVRSLARLNPTDDSLLNLARENLRDDDVRVRLAVVNLLVDRPGLRARMAPDFEALLSSDRDGVARHAAFLLGQGGPDAVPRLLAALRRNGGRIEPIAEGLTVIGRPAVASLLQALGDPAPRVRRGSALALGQIRPVAPTTVEKLTGGLADPDPEVRLAFLIAIGQLGPRAAGSVPAVKGLLNDPSAEIRGRAIEVLFQSAPRDEALLVDLARLLDDADLGVQRRAIDALRALGPMSRKTLPVVIHRLESPDPDVRLAAVQMVESQGADAIEAIPSLIPLLADPSPKLRAIVAATLGRSGKPAQPAFARLAGLLDDPEVVVREAAISALGGLEVDAETLRPHLAKALQDEKAEVRRAATRVIPRLGPSALILVPDIILMASRKENARSVDRLLRPFERTGPDPRSIAELTRLLDHDQVAVRLLAIKFLGLAGPAAAEALPHLERLAQDPAVEVRQPAKAAAEKIKTSAATPAA